MHCLIKKQNMYVNYLVELVYNVTVKFLSPQMSNEQPSIHQHNNMSEISPSRHKRVIYFLLILLIDYTKR